MTLLAAGVCQLCSSVRSVAFTAVRTVRKRAIRPVDSYSSIPSDSSDPRTPPPSPSSAQHPQQTSLLQLTSSPSQLTSSPSQLTSCSSQITSSPSKITNLSPRLPPSLPSHGQTIPKAVFGLTEAKLQELAAAMPPVMTRRENVVEIQPPSPPDNRVVRKTIQTTEGNQHEVVADVYTPLWRKPYAEQLQHKETGASLVLKKLKDRIFNVYGLPLPEQLPLLPCPLHPIVTAPAEQGYRNEDTFTVWRGVDGNPKTVGLLTGDPKTAGTACVAPSSLLSVRKEHKLFCQLFEDHIRLSKHPSFIDFHEAPGVWRSVTVRSNDVGHIIACVHIFPHLLNEEDLLKIEDDLREYFCRGSGSAVGLTSLYLHVSNTTHKCRHKDPYRLVFGVPHIEESCAHNKFRILPDTSFPFNREAEELVISAVQKTAGINESTNLLHLGSGSGVQSLALARHVRRVVCLESSAAAVEDLEFNLQLNDITNVAVQDGPVHQSLAIISPDLRAMQDVVAVVNCGDKTLHPQSVYHLRKTRGISKLLLLTTKPDGHAIATCASFTNKLGRNKLGSVPPMLPVLAFTVDIAPHTHQYLMGILFSRDEYFDVSAFRD